jgi:hypothetical protein
MEKLSRSASARTGVGSGDEAALAGQVPRRVDHPGPRRTGRTAGYLRGIIGLRVKGSAGRGPPAAAGSEGVKHATASDRLTPSLRIPIRSCREKVSSVSSPYPPPEVKGFTGIFEKDLDFVREMNSAVRMVSMGSMGDMGHSMCGTGYAMEGTGSTENTVTCMMRGPSTAPHILTLSRLPDCLRERGEAGGKHLEGHR